MSDNVNHPDHYNKGEIECIAAIEDWGFAEHGCAFNVIKYVNRYMYKGNEFEDAKKVAWYAAYMAMCVGKRTGEVDPKVTIEEFIETIAPKCQKEIGYYIVCPACHAKFNYNTSNEYIDCPSCHCVMRIIKCDGQITVYPIKYNMKVDLSHEIEVSAGVKEQKFEPTIINIIADAEQQIFQCPSCKAMVSFYDMGKAYCNNCGTDIYVYYKNDRTTAYPSKEAAMKDEAVVPEEGDEKMIRGV